MEVGKLSVKRRYKVGKGMARRLRAEGKIPAVCYGAALDQPLSLEVDTRAFRASLDPVRRHNTVIDLTVEDDGQPAASLTVMVKDYQVHPIRRDLTHVDFMAVDESHQVTVEVPIEFTGKAKGLVSGGTLHVVRHVLEIRCRPADIPEKVLVDVAELDVGGVIHVSDLRLTEGIVPTLPAHLTLITCVAPEAETGAGEGAEAKS
jgi:large subunit ribosomal protein L25